MDLWVDTNVSEEYTASIFRAEVLKTEAVCPTETLVPPVTPHSVKIQKTNIDIFTAVRISNLISI
jgi:hypothetical protein